MLREAFAGWLPDEILWRRKEQFGDGSGTADVMAERAADLAPDDDWEQVRVAGPAARAQPGGARLPAAVRRARWQGIRSERVLGRFATA